MSDYYIKAEVDAKLRELREWVNSVVSSGGGTEPEPEEPDEPSVYNLKKSTSNSSWTTLNAINVKFDVPEEIQGKVKKVIVNTCTLTIGKYSAVSGAPTIYFRICGQSLSETTLNSNITSVSQSASNGSSVTKTIKNQEVNIDNFSSIEYFQLYKAQSSGSGTTTSYSASFDIDLYY